MKKTHLIIAALLWASTTLVSFWCSAATSWVDNIIPVEEMYQQVTCDDTSKVYLNQDNDTDSLWDFWWYLNSNFILDCNATYASHSYAAGQILRTNTKVKYYTPLYNMMYKVMTGGEIDMIDETTFYRASRAFPCNTPTRGIATTPNKIVFEQPSDNSPENKTVSVVYQYTYTSADGFDGTTNSSYRYNQIPSMDYFLNTNVTYKTLLPGTYGNRKRSRNPTQTLNKCNNFELHRCGDGIKDEPSSSYVALFTWEKCDDGALNGTPGYCDISCGNAGWSIPRCGDNIIQELWSTPYDSNNDWIDDGESWEECDDGDNPNDLLAGGDGAINTETIWEWWFCSNICLYHFVEAFVEVFINE